MLKIETVETAVIGFTKKSPTAIMIRSATSEINTTEVARTCKVIVPTPVVTAKRISWEVLFCIFNSGCANNREINSAETFAPR